MILNDVRGHRRPGDRAPVLFLCQMAAAMARMSGPRGRPRPRRSARRAARGRAGSCPDGWKGRLVIARGLAKHPVAPPLPVSRPGVERLADRPADATAATTTFSQALRLS